MADEKKPKRGRPAGSKNKKTLVKEARAKATAKAKKALDKAQGGGKKGKQALIDVTELCTEQGFDPVTEAIILYREIEADPFDLDGRRTRLDIIKMLMPFYAPKKAPQQDTGTGNKIPVFQINFGAPQGPAPVQMGAAPVAAPQIHLPETIDVKPEDQT